MDNSLTSKCKLVHEIFNQMQLEELTKGNEGKSENTASVHRNTGNDFYKGSEYKLALQNYNKAILNAPLDSVEYSRGLANRSAVLYMLGKYDKCLIDIERALVSGYEGSLKPKLIKRKISCMEILSRQPTVETEFDRVKLKHTTLPKEVNTSIPCARKFVQITRMQSNKRAVIATEDCHAGELIAVEDPHSFHLLEDYYLLRCQNCCARCDCMIPCEACPFAMYCDEKCREFSYRSTHRYICPIISLIYKNISNVDFVALHSVIRARMDRSSWKELWDVVESADKQKDSNFRGYVQIGNGHVYDSNHYTSVHTLSTERANAGGSSLRLGIMGGTAAVLVHFLKSFTSFFADCPDECMPGLAVQTNKYEFMFCGLLLHNLMVTLANPVHIGGITLANDRGKNNTDDSRFGWGTYPFTCLMEHSCTPNVNLTFVNKTLVLTAIRPIKKGQQFRINYGAHYGTEPYLNRKAFLKTTFQLDCNCEACANNWPTALPYGNLSKGSFNKFTCSLKSIYGIFGFGTQYQFENFLSLDMVKSLNKGDRDVLVEAFPRICEAVDFLDDYAPCQEFADYGFMMIKCISLFGNIISEDEMPLVTYMENVSKKYTQ